jgi:hypothetical protein
MSIPMIDTEYTAECTQYTAEYTQYTTVHDYRSWKDLLPQIVAALDSVSAGKLLTVSAEWEQIIRKVWRIKPIVMTNGMWITIWVEVAGQRTNPSWWCVVVRSGSLKFTKHNTRGICAGAIADHTQKSTLMADFSPLMYHEAIRRRLRVM